MADISDVARRFDDVLRNMAGQAGSLEALLGVFFSFLHRNTDFYVTYDPATTVRAGMGFPVGKAEQLLIKAFRSFPFKPYDGQQAQAARGGAKQTKTKTEITSRNAPAAKPLTVGAPGRPGESKLSASPRPKPEDASEGLASGASEPTDTTTPKPVPRQPKTLPQQCKSSTDTSPLSSTPAGAAGRSTASAFESDVPQSGSAPEGIRVRYTEDGKQVPIGNGGVTPRYYWTQTIGEATVYVDVPSGTRSKDVSCVIEPRRLKLVVRGAGSAAEGHTSDVLIEGELPSAVSREESMWSLVDGKMVVISLEKVSRSWWKGVVEGDPEIDTTQVDSTTRIGEYDEETQGTIRKIMFDQRQKALGLPTSDELSAEAILEKAKKLPGSPFLPSGTFSRDGALPGGMGSMGPDCGERDPET